MQPNSLVISFLAMFVMMGVQHGSHPGVPRHASLKIPPNQWCRRIRWDSLDVHHNGMPPHHSNSKERKCYQVFQMIQMCCVSQSKGCSMLLKNVEPFHIRLAPEWKMNIMVNGSKKRELKFFQFQRVLETLHRRVFLCSWRTGKGWIFGSDVHHKPTTDRLVKVRNFGDKL